MKKTVKLFGLFIFLINTLQAQVSLDTSAIQALIKKAYTICENEPQQTINLGKEALVASKKINFLKGEIGSYNTIGVGFDIIAKYDSSLYYYNKGLINFKNLNNASLKASIYNNLGLTYWNLSEYKKAIESYYKALEIFKKTNDTKGLAKTYNNLGLLYDDMLEAKTAIVNYKEAIKNYTLLNDTNGLSVAYVNLGSTYNDLENRNEAEFYYRKSLVLKSVNDYYGKSIVLLNWAQVKNSIHQTDSAILFIKKAILFKNKINDINGLIAAYNVLSNTYNELKQYSNSVGAAKNALLLNKEVKSKKRLVRTYGLLKRAYLYSNEPDSAMRYNNLEYELKDSIFSENLSESIANEKIKYETLEVENENLVLKLKTEKQSFTLKTIWIALGFAIISIIIFLFFYLRFKKNKNIIKEQQQQNKINQVVFDTEQQERERIARDLHDSVGQKLSVVKMQLSMKNADVITSSNLLDEAIQDVRNVSHNLMPADLSKGLLNALENMQEQINFSSTTLKLHLNITANAQALTIDKQHSLLIYRMVQELVNNAIKYAQAQNIHINMDCEKNQIKLNLTDDGVGFDINALEKKDGLGIRSIKERVQQLIGNLQLTSSIGKGTQFNISIPV
jgi:two-component system, NarL family, sensor kinase